MLHFEENFLVFFREIYGNKSNYYAITKNFNIRLQHQSTPLQFDKYFAHFRLIGIALILLAAGQKNLAREDADLVTSLVDLGATFLAGTIGRLRHSMERKKFSIWKAEEEIKKKKLRNSIRLGSRFHRSFRFNRCFRNWWYSSFSSRRYSLDEWS